MQSNDPAHSAEDSAERMLWPYFGNVNPVWSWGLALPEAALVTTWHGCHERLSEVYSSCGEIPADKIRLPDHVFPVVSKIEPGCHLGLLVPVSAEPRERWHVSDAFGRFVPDRGSVDASFDWLIGTIEDAWRSSQGSVLPLRWRQPFALHVIPPVHLDSVKGSSLQWPMAVALLRAAAAAGDPAGLPFGPGPVFATGTLGASGLVGPVDHVREKLEGFWREYGKGRPVLLTSTQKDELEALEALSSFGFSEANVHEVNSLMDLFELPQFQKACAALSDSPKSTDLDHYMLAIEREDAGIRFSQVSDMVEWLLPEASSLPSYAFRLRFKRGQVHLHGGAAPVSREDWVALDQLVATHSVQFGADDRLALAAAWGVYWMDVGSPEEGLRRLDQPDIAEARKHASLGQRAEWHDVAAELSRAAGHHDRAVEEGWSALRAATGGQGRLAGKMANHTVHALLCRARATTGAPREQDLQAAQTLLGESKGIYAPSLDPRTRDSHLGFCRHLDAEWHRVAGLGYAPEMRNAALGYWDHPYLFTLLSAARNPANPPQQRRHCAEVLFRHAESMRDRLKGEVFVLFVAIYNIVRAAAFGDPLDVAVDRLESVLCDHAATMVGWPRRLQPALAALRAAETPAQTRLAVDALCDAVPHH